MTSKNKTPAEPQATATIPAKPPQRKWVILLVDDEPEILRSLKKLMTQSLAGTQILTATSGRAGLEILERERVDLIMCDFKMPGMDGIEFLVQARRLRPAVPRIMFTAFADNDLAHRAVSEAIVSAFFPKSFGPTQMIDEIEALMRYNPELPSQQ